MQSLANWQHVSKRRMTDFKDPVSRLHASQNMYQWLLMSRRLEKKFHKNSSQIMEVFMIYGLFF